MADINLSPLQWVNAAIRYGKGVLSGDVPAHEEEYERQYKYLKQKLGLPTNVQGNAYDRAKNFAGGYDWARRSGDSYEDIYDLAAAYQSTDPEGYLDLMDNMAGVKEAIGSKSQRPLTFEELMELAINYGNQQR